MKQETFEKAYRLKRQIERIESELKEWQFVGEGHEVCIKLDGSYNSGRFLTSSLDIMWLKEIEVKRLTEKIGKLVKQFDELQCE